MSHDLPTQSIDKSAVSDYDLLRSLVLGYATQHFAMNAIIYCRVSSKEQTEGTSLESQRVACEEFARGKHMTVLRTFIEQGESAKYADRTQLLELIDFCRVGKRSIDVLLVWKVDRFARNVADHYSIKATLAKYGVRIVSVTEPIDANPEGQLMETILAGFAQFDNEIRTTRSVQGMRRKIQEGIFPWHPPLGYKSPRKGREKKNEPDQPDQPLFGLLQKAWQQFATGAYTKAEIRRLMGTWGITSRRGEPLANQSVDYLFANPYYAGILIDPWSKEEHQGLHVPMVSREEFARVQQILAGRNRSLIHTKYRKEFALRGVVRCPRCSWYLTGSASRGRSRYYAYYHCHNNGCDRRGHGLPVDKVDAEFTNFLSDIAPKPIVFQQLSGHIETAAYAQDSVLKARRARATISRAQLDREVQELIRLRTQGLIGDVEFQTHRKMLAEKQLVVGAVPTAQVKASPVELRQQLDDISTSLYQLASTWEEMSMSVRPRFQRMILPVGFVAGKVRTAEIGLLFRVEEVFADAENGDVPLTPSFWNQVCEEIQALWRLLKGVEDNDDAVEMPV